MAVEPQAVVVPPEPADAQAAVYKPPRTRNRPTTDERVAAVLARVGGSA